MRRPLVAVIFSTSLSLITSDSRKQAISPGRVGIFESLAKRFLLSVIPRGTLPKRDLGRLVSGSKARRDGVKNDLFEDFRLSGDFVFE